MRATSRRCGRKAPRSQLEMVVRRTARREAASPCSSFKSSLRLRMWSPNVLSSRGHG